MRRLTALALTLVLWLGCTEAASALDFTLPDHIARVLPAGPPAAVALYQVAPEKLVGWVLPLPEQALPYILESYRTLPVAGRLTGKEATLNADAVKALHPDLIVDIGDLDPQYRALADKIQSETGIPYVVLDGSLANMPELYMQLSQLVDAGLRGDKLAILSASALAHVAAKKGSALRPGRIYYAASRDGPESGGMAGKMDGIDPQVIDAIGALNFVGRHSGDGHQDVTPGQLADWNPDLVIAATPEIAHQLRTDPDWRAVPAIAAGNVHVAPGLPWGWLGGPPGVNRLIGLEWLAALLYPQVPKPDLAADTRAFYRNFYQVELTDAQLQALLGP